VVLSEDAKAALHAELLEAAEEADRETVEYCAGEFPGDSGNHIRPRSAR
jgi:hypothetical protein